MSIFSNGILGPILGFLLGLIPLILVHELGHFMMARLTGVWAREFGIGYPPRIVKLFKWKETDFTLNWLPLGGFVRLEGEETFKEKDQEPEEKSPEQLAYEAETRSNSLYSRLEGEEIFEETVQEPEEKSPEQLAYEAEARSHSLYGKSAWQRILLYLGGPAMNLITAWVLAVVLFLSGIPAVSVVVEEVNPGSPAEQANVQVGDVIVALNGNPVEASGDVQLYTAKAAGSSIELSLEREGTPLTVSLTPRSDPPEGEGPMGIIIGGVEKPGSLKRYSLGEAISYGTNYVTYIGGMTVMLPVMLLRGQIPLDQGRPVGVVGISRIAQRSVEDSITAGASYPFMTILILLSISLGIFNLLPIPALDGGRIMFVLIEKIRRKPLPPEIEERIHMVAFMLLLAVFLVITALDIFVPVQLP
ncbi:MAG: site-2 protease family protein [Anaerolineae bacterium]|nr:site-2 protease family protein [Anaerolineae bacterium]